MAKVIFSDKTSDMFLKGDNGDLYNEMYLRSRSRYTSCLLRARLDHIVTNVEILRDLGMRVTKTDVLYVLKYDPDNDSEDAFTIGKNDDGTFTVSWEDELICSAVFKEV